MKNILKKLNILILAISVVFFNTSAFAEASIIYAPTTATTVPPTYANDNSITTITPESEVISVMSYEEGSIEYETVYNIVEENNNYYCIENGDYVRNGWRKISRRSYAQYAPVDGYYDSYIWAYFGSNARAVRGSSNSIKKVKIGNYSYAFNEYGMLLTGFFNEYGEMWIEHDEEDPFDLISDGTLYHADEASGVLTTGWYKMRNTTSRYPNKNVIWLYFNPSNFKITRSTGNNYKSLKVDGKNYAFDDNGVMLTGFEASDYNEEHGGSSKTVYFGADGAEITSGFYNVDLSDDENYERFEDYDDYDEDITIYLSKNGKVYTNTIKKINSNYYGFDYNGVVLKGLTVWENGNYKATIDTESTNGKRFIVSGVYSIKNGGQGTLNSYDELHYFDQRGKRITTSSAKIEFSDYVFTYYANNNGALSGTHNGKYYVHGLLIKPEDGVKYGVYLTNPTKSNYSMSEIVNMPNIVVNSSGNVISSKSAQKDENDNYWLISNSSLVNIYSVQIRVSNGTYYFRSTSKAGKDDWIPFGEKDINNRTCVADVMANGTRTKDNAISYYQVKLYPDAAINFNIN